MTLNHLKFFELVTMYIYDKIYFNSTDFYISLCVILLKMSLELPVLNPFIVGHGMMAFLKILLGIKPTYVVYIFSFHFI